MGRQSGSEKKSPVVSRREYKVMLDHRLFADRKQAAAELWSEMQACADRLHIGTRGDFHKTEKRQIVFLDTSDHVIRLNRLVLRQRIDLEEGDTEYTLKCRSPDRYVAAGANVGAEKGVNGKHKFEEDICPPFVSRFSNSTTVEGPENGATNLKKAARLFPLLGKLQRDGRPCSEKLELVPVNALQPYERVLTGAALNIAGTEAELALIVWSDGLKGRPLVAEFSFRYSHDEERFNAETARLALDLFSDIQRLDWCRPDSRTKTQYIYRIP